MSEQEQTDASSQRTGHAAQPSQADELLQAAMDDDTEGHARHFKMQQADDDADDTEGHARHF